MNKKQQASEQSKRRIADTALMLFINKGYHATSIGEIVAASGCSKGNLYHHFKSKENLFLYLLDEWDRKWYRAWEERSARYGSIVETLYGLTEFQALDDFSNPLLKAWDEFLSVEQQKSEVKEHLERLFASYRQFNERIFAEGIRRGEIKEEDTRMLSLVFDSLLRGLGANSRNMSLQETLNMNKNAIRILLNGIHTSGITL